MQAVRKVMEGALDTGPGDGNYFLESGSLSWKALSDALARHMYERGLVDAPESKSWTLAEASKALGFPKETTEKLWASHTVTRGAHSRQIGWTPEYDVDWLLSHIETEVRPAGSFRLRLRVRTNHNAQIE